MSGYRYVIVGGGLAGASSVKGIRKHDAQGSILLLGAEAHKPYDRPPLTKKLWFGKKKVEEIFLNPPDFYEKNGVDLKTGVRAASIDPMKKKVRDEAGCVHGYEKLLLATGGTPRILDIPGGNIEGISYYRTLDDYNAARAKAAKGAAAVVIGGGFIGSEIAAGLNHAGAEVTMVFPSEYVCNKVFTRPLGEAVQKDYRSRGIKIFANTTPSSFEKKGERFVTRTADGKSFESDILIAGIGITPDIGLAKAAGLKTSDGIEVDSYLRTTDANIYSAGDCANFPYKALGRNMRVEHWDNALTQGELAGENMAGAGKEYDHMPYFFSDLFDFGYEAVGDVNSKLEVFADWKEENSTGVLYYLKDGEVKGVMLCNVWEKVDKARELIRKGGRVSKESLKGLIA